MDQDALDRAVAAATGETVREVRRRGFVLADPPFPSFDPEPSPWSLHDDGGLQADTTTRIHLHVHPR
jgi:hypothetical protein